MARTSSQTKKTVSIKTLIIWTFLGLYALGSLITLWAVHSFMKQHAITNAEKTGQMLLDHNLATHYYFNEHLKPSVFDLVPGEVAQTYFEPRWMSSTYAIRKIHKQFQILGGKDYYYKECAINARTQENEADPFERTFILNLNQKTELIRDSSIRYVEGEPFLQMLRRGETIKKECLKCHGNPEDAPAGLVALYGKSASFYRQIGETVSAISIKIPLSKAFAEVRNFSWKLSVFFLFILMIFFIFQIFLIKNILLLPLERIRNRARQINGDKKHLGDMIKEPFGKELQEVTSSFNNMSANLEMQMETLEETVDRRTRCLRDTCERLRESERQYRQLAYFDPVTSLPNRILFLDRLQQNLTAVQRERVRLAVIFLDLDRFKEINDHYGHDFGDMLLKKVGQRMAAALRESDTCARFAGDEFTIILRHIHEPDDALMAMERIQQLFTAPFQVMEEELIISASIGASLYPEHGHTADDLLEKADHAMYAAKHGGKARAFLYGQTKP